MRKLYVVTGLKSELAAEIVQTILDRALGDVIATTRSELSGFTQRSGLTVVPGVDLATSDGIKTTQEFIDAARCDAIALIHCAGFFPMPSTIRYASLNDAQAAFAGNYLSFVGALQGILPRMRDLRNGRILAFTSHTTDLTPPYLGLFNASKSALESLIKTTANESARHGIAANGLAVATLSTQAEFKLKPSGDHGNWLGIREVAEVSLQILAMSDIINGNIIQCWRHSDSFFGQSYLERNCLSKDY
jgi:NAD(P)-dependent dehydrogenase (short-subunit alcohol dehydrogenase family)